MKPPLTFYLMACTYNSYGGHRTLSTIPDFLLLDAPDFGPGLIELTVTLHFPTSGPPLPTLGDMYERSVAYRRSLPKVEFRRSRQKASVTLASEIMDGSDDGTRYALSQSLFVSGYREIIRALNLLRPKFKAQDAFAFERFFTYCQNRGSRLPKTEEEFVSLMKQLDENSKARIAAMTPWERLDIDWKDFHPDAQAILDNPFFWDEADDFSPHGNDTGADLLADYRRWLMRHSTEGPLKYYQELATKWGFSLEVPDETADEAAVALAIAELKLRGTCQESAIELAKQAVERQREVALNTRDWPHREQRLNSLDAIEAILRRVT